MWCIMEGKASGKTQISDLGNCVDVMVLTEMRQKDGSKQAVGTIEVGALGGRGDTEGEIFIGVAGNEPGAPE